VITKSAIECNNGANQKLPFAVNTTIEHILQ